MLHDTTPSSHGNHPEHAAGWTDERTASLKQLWREGKSASQIAVILGGGVTRNGVIGKVSRLKLDKRVTVSIRAEKATGGNGSAGKHRGIVDAARKARTKGQPKAAAIAHRVAMRPAIVPIPEPAEEGVDVTHLLGLTQLNEHTCKWPHGDPLLPDFGFCGEHTQEGSSYCPKHHRRAYLRAPA